MVALGLFIPGIPSPQDWRHDNEDDDHAHQHDPIGGADLRDGLCWWGGGCPRGKSCRARICTHLIRLAERRANQGQQKTNADQGSRAKDVQQVFHRFGWRKYNMFKYGNSHPKYVLMSPFGL